MTSLLANPDLFIKKYNHFSLTRCRKRRVWMKTVCCPPIRMQKTHQKGFLFLSYFQKSPLGSICPRLGSSGPFANVSPKSSNSSLPRKQPRCQSSGKGLPTLARAAVNASQRKYEWAFWISLYLGISSAIHTKFCTRKNGNSRLVEYRFSEWRPICPCFQGAGGGRGSQEKNVGPNIHGVAGCV